MSERSLRVALLARAGEACDRIGNALREAGAELVLVADPAATAESAVRDTAPQAIVVALEPAIEDALEGFEALLSDPSYMVLFEEAELAAQRAGWDAARWMRHLSAKLHRHGDVLPPGGEDEHDLQPSPGPLPERVLEVDFDEAIAAFADEAQQHAEDVPRDSGIEGLSLADGPLSMAPAEEASSAFDPVAFETSELSLVEEDRQGLPEMAFGDLEAAAAHEDAAPERSIDRPLADEAIEVLRDADIDIDDTGASLDAASVAPGGLTLAADDMPTPHAARAPAASIEHLENRISGLSLADVDSYGHGPERGAVLVEAGLGGPDAVRQLLGAIPAGFPRPVLVRMQLDGGRYDRLVKQMERASALPVSLAEAGGAAQPEQVYFLPPTLGVRRERGQLQFDDGDDLAQPLPQALPPGDSAVLLLSGASRRVADATARGAWTAALVAGQSPDGSYDPDAALSLLERGGRVGTAAELAALLIERWMPQQAATTDFEDPQA